MPDGRPPCGGWKEPPERFVGGCFQHFRRSESAYIAAINVINGGSGYTWANVIIDPPALPEPYGQQAEAFAIISPTGVIQHISVTVPGRGYTRIPAVTIQGDGSGAIAQAVVSGRSVKLNGFCDQQTGQCQQFPSPAPECPGGLLVDGNCYLPTDPPIYLDQSDCRKAGWKSILLQKQYHGALGRTQRLETGATIPRRYLACRYRVQMDYSASDETVTIDVSGLWRVNKLSGRYELEGWSENISRIFGGQQQPIGEDIYRFIYISCTLSAQQVGWNPDVWNWRMERGQYEPASPVWFLVVADNTPGVLPEQDFVQWWMDSYGMAFPNVSVTLSKSDTDAVFRMTGSNEIVSFDWRISIIYEEPWSPSEAVAVILEHADAWDLSNEFIHNWREDTACDTVPFIQLREFLARQPRTGHIKWSDWLILMDQEEQSGMDGSLIGAPLPEAVGKHHDFSGGRGWSPASTAQMLEGRLKGFPPAATAWENSQTWAPGPGLYLADGAWAMSVQSGSAAVIAAKIFILIADRFPSQNYFRPCGSDRFKIDTRDESYEQAYGPGIGYCHSQENPQTYPPLYAYRDANNNPIAWPICGSVEIVSAENIDSTHVRLVLGDGNYLLIQGDQVDISGVPGINGMYAVQQVNASEIIIEGQLTAPYSGGGSIKSHGAPDPSWNDHRPKGDFVIMVWRQLIGESTQTEVQCQQACMKRNACCPTVLALSPADHRFCHQFRWWFDNVDWCVIGTAFSQAYPVPAMPDPLFIWRRQCPEGTVELDCVPMVEARCHPPAGAPPAPLTYSYDWDQEGGQVNLWLTSPPVNTCWKGKAFWQRKDCWEWWDVL